MQEIKLNGKNYLLVEVPNGAFDFRYKIMPDEQKQLVGTIKDEDGNIGTCYIRDITQGRIIGTISNIIKDENVCKGLIEENREFLYKNYISDNDKAGFNNATNSFLSYLQSIDLDMTKEYLLIEKP